MDRHTKVREARTHLCLALICFCLAVVIERRARWPGEQHWDREVLVEEGMFGGGNEGEEGRPEILMTGRRRGQ